MKSRIHYLRAFSLPELLVVLVIVGILVLIALPNLMPLISRAKASEAQHLRMENKRRYTAGSSRRSSTVSDNFHVGYGAAALHFNRRQ